MIAQSTQTFAKREPAKILVVDDEPQVRRALRAILAGQGCSVIEARDGEEAVEEMKADRPDLVLLDINMPGIDGLETCKRIRELSDVPIIMVTVRANEKDKVAALDAGADDYLVKPFGTQELLARVRAAVRRLAECGRDSRVLFAEPENRFRTAARDRPRTAGAPDSDGI